MSVPVLFALIGGVILAGFLANLLFRLTRIPSVLLLVAIGVVLGPLTGWIRSDALMAVAPYFGAAALLVILFEGGLELDIMHVVRQAPRAAVLAGVVFGLSLVGVAAVAHLLLGFSSQAALMLGAVLAATSPAICLPVVSGLSVREEVKTLIKLETAIGEVLLVVTVVLLVESYTTGAGGAMGWALGFAKSFFVALLISSVAGVLWARLVGWMGREPLSYMLTLGMVCLLYFAVEELGGSPAIAILLFGLILANMQSIAGRVAPRLRELFGVDLREEQFLLNQFIVNITAELSFLLRTFFFVYLGLLLDFSLFTWTVAGGALAMFVLLLVSRRAGIGVFARGGPSFTPGELQTIMALLPRGLATAVVAFIPVQAGVPGTQLFPLYVFLIILLSNAYMTAGIVFAERRLRQAAEAARVSAEDERRVSPELLGEGAFALAGGGLPVAVHPHAVHVALPSDTFVPPPASPARSPSPFSPAADFAHEPPPANLSDWMARLFGLRLADREIEYGELIRASYFREPLFWVQALLGATICTLGLFLDQAAIVIGGALIVPLVRPVVATGLAVGSGDIYLLAKLLVKLCAFVAMVVGLAAGLIEILPFSAITSEIAARVRPTLLDFLVALFGGMSGAALLSHRNRMYHYLPGAVMAITLLPALCVMGFGLADNVGGQLLRGGGLQFTANLFAAVLGASVVVVLIGIPRAAEAESIRQWKEQELARPVVQAIFGRLKLQHVIGRTGSVRARLVVVAIFLLLVLIPLQSAFNQLTREFRTRQAISRAQSEFEIPGRSAVLNSSFVVGEHDVTVRIQVATNELFTGQEIARFEQRVMDQLGRPARLDLVQTLGDVGQADTMRGILLARDRAAAPTRRTVAESLQETRALVERVIAEMPMPDTLRLVTVRSAVVGDPSIEIVYLADRILGDDARAILARLLSERTRIGSDGVRLRWVPAALLVELSRAGTIARADEPALRRQAAALADFPELGLVIEMPATVPAATAERGRQEIVRQLGVSERRVVMNGGAEGQGAVRLRVVPRDSEKKAPQGS